MTDFQLLTDFRRSVERQGPGGEAETSRALELAGLKQTIFNEISEHGIFHGILV